MPWSKFIDDPQFGRVGIRQIDQLDAKLEVNFELSPEENTEFKSIQSSGRKKQWLAVRHALHDLSGETQRLHTRKDTFGKPFFPESNQFFSLSHTKDHVAVLLHNKDCGIDIERKRKQIIKIAPRFLSSDELKNIPEDDNIKYSTIYWCCKEAIYKAYGKRELDLREEIKIESLEKKDDFFRSNAIIYKNGIEIQYKIMAMEYDQNIMAIAIKK